MKNNFEVFVSEDTSAAKNLILAEILPKLEFESVSGGDSITMRSTEIIEEIEKGLR